MGQLKGKRMFTAGKECRVWEFRYDGGQWLSKRLVGGLAG